MDKETKTKPESIMDFAMQIFSLCNNCKHKDVCKYLHERDGKAELCKDFLSAGDHKTYNNIYNFFQPIFDWIARFHPMNDVKFVIDRFGAKMYLEHGVSALSKEVDYCIPLPDNEKAQSQSKPNEETISNCEDI